jgi:hypothetical protein
VSPRCAGGCSPAAISRPPCRVTRRVTTRHSRTASRISRRATA